MVVDIAVESFDVLVNDAAIAAAGPTASERPEELTSLVGVNLSRTD